MGHNIKRIIKEEYVNYMLNEHLNYVEKLHEAKWNFSHSAVIRASEILAKAMANVDKVAIEVHNLEWDKGRGAGFDLSWDGDKGDGGSYGVSANGDIVNHAYPGKPVYGNIRSNQRDFEKGIRKYSKRRNEGRASLSENGIMYKAGVKKYSKEGMTKIQSAAGKGKGHEEIGKIKDKYDKSKTESVEEVSESIKPIKLSGNLKKDLKIVVAMAGKMVKYAKDNFNTYIPTGHMLSQLINGGSTEQDVLKYNIAHLAKAINTDLKRKYMKDFMGEGKINEGKSFYQDVVDLNKSFRLLKIQSPDSYKEIDKKFKVRDIQKLLSNIKTFMDTVPAMREGKVNEAQLQDLPIRSLLGLGVKATVNMGEKKLYDLSEAFEGWLIDNDDNTYEGITAHLDMAIELIQEREPKEAKPHLKKFNKECAKALKEMRRFDEAKFNKKSVNEMQVINKKTGKDVTKHMLAYMEGKITKEEFEKLTGLSKEKIKVSESDAEYAKSLQTIARDKQLKMLSKKDKETLLKIADLMKRANEGTVDVSEEQMAVLKEKLVFYVDKKGKKRRFDTDASANKKYTKK